MKGKELELGFTRNQKKWKGKVESHSYLRFLVSKKLDINLRFSHACLNGAEEVRLMDDDDFRIWEEKKN
jgi:hypothetical protein